MRPYKIAQRRDQYSKITGNKCLLHCAAATPGIVNKSQQLLSRCTPASAAVHVTSQDLMMPSFPVMLRSQTTTRPHLSHCLLASVSARYRPEGSAESPTTVHWQFAILVQRSTTSRQIRNFPPRHLPPPVMCYSSVSLHVQVFAPVTTPCSLRASKTSLLTLSADLKFLWIWVRPVRWISSQSGTPLVPMRARCQW